MRTLLIVVMISLLASGAMAAPQLLTGAVASTGSDTDSVYVFSVSYKGDFPAEEVVVVINEVSYPMLELDQQDLDLTDGKAYYYETKLDAGVNSYQFKCADTNGSLNTSVAKMLLVKDVPTFELTHLDVVFAVLVWLPFVVYFIYLTRKMTKALERLEKQGERKEEKEQ